MTMANHGLPMTAANAEVLAPILRPEISTYLRANGPRVPLAVQAAWDALTILKVATWAERHAQGFKSEPFPISDEELAAAEAKLAPTEHSSGAEPAAAVDARTDMIDPGHDAEPSTEEPQAAMTAGDEESAAASEMQKKTVPKRGKR